MPLPDSQTLLLPVLRVLSDGFEHSSESIRQQISVEFKSPRKNFERNTGTALPYFTTVSHGRWRI
jgi:hypothetical protein